MWLGKFCRLRLLYKYQLRTKTLRINSNSTFGRGYQTIEFIVNLTQSNFYLCILCVHLSYWNIPNTCTQNSFIHVHVLHFYRLRAFLYHPHCWMVCMNYTLLALHMYLMSPTILLHNGYELYIYYGVFFIYHIHAYYQHKTCVKYIFVNA